MLDAGVSCSLWFLFGNVESEVASLLLMCAYMCVDLYVLCIILGKYKIT